MNPASELAAPPKPPPRRWYRQYGSTWLMAIAVASVLVTLNLSGFIRAGRREYLDGNNFHLEWRYGWPLDYLSRHVGVDGAGTTVDLWALTSGVIDFKVVALIADMAMALAILAIVVVVVRRRRRLQKPLFQYRLRTLFASVLLVGAIFGWGRFDYLRQKKAVADLAPHEFGFMVDEGVPHWLRQYLPGERLRPFDRVAFASLMGPECFGDRLAALAQLQHLTGLEVAGPLDDQGLSHVGGLAGLVWLHVDICCVTDDGLAHLAGLTRMRSLAVSSDQITEIGPAHLERMPQLESLELSHTKITDDGLIPLRGATSLKYLGLCETPISDDGLDHIAHLGNLEMLNLRATSITDAGLFHLSSLNRLKFLLMEGTRISPDGLQKLESALPNCDIRH
ncbi:MAG TPA: hypothetical protein VND64_06640 [Pirellulales bacterium]|nr:hypothetical protein [Pirellulales bacterium]